MAHQKTFPGPAYDEEVSRLLPPNLEAFASTNTDQITVARQAFEVLGQSAFDSIQSDPSLEASERLIPGPAGELKIVIVRPKNRDASRTRKLPGIYHVHGGGLTAGTRFGGLDLVAEWVKEAEAVAVAVEYRLPPEHPHPAPIEDCYAGLVWMYEHAEELGIDPRRIMVEGQSAGGGIAASLALMARDKKGPPLCAQLLGVPMLDDRNNSVSCAQFPSGGSWNEAANKFAWSCLLGDRAGGEGVSPYASPARATDLSGLPPAFIDVSAAEPFRDEAVEYATRLWHHGIQAELHVWPGGPHAFDVVTPGAALSKTSISTRTAWVKRTLAPAPV